MPNYEHSKIYKIVCNETGEVYIGSTTLYYLSNRIAGHKTIYKRNLKRQCASKNIIARNNFTAELIEKYPCESREELNKRERYWIENTENCINVCKRPYVTETEKKELCKELEKKYVKKRAEYRNANKAQTSARSKRHYDEKKEEILQKQKKYYEENKEALLLKKKAYREEHKEERATKGKAYREANKEKIKEQKRLAYLRKKERESDL